jgi:AcrR family transcriptional regulator
MSGFLAAEPSEPTVPTVPTESTRRLLTARQADTVRRLTEAGIAEVGDHGYEALSIRDVARRAGVAAATAYTYFSSKDHLLTEIFWRRLNALPEVAAGDRGTRPAVVAVLRELSTLVSAEPELAAGVTAAMYGSEPDVQHLRAQIGMRIHQRIQAAAGEGTQAAEVLELAYFGAMVQAGLGYTTYEHMAARLAEAARLIMPD